MAGPLQTLIIIKVQIDIITAVAGGGKLIVSHTFYFMMHLKTKVTKNEETATAFFCRNFLQPEYRLDLHDADHFAPTSSFHSAA
jgi:hypothetical protein